jgi:hypothetical protein
VTGSNPSDRAAVEAVSAALAPYPWRSFTPEQVARRAVAARDRHALADLLQAVAGGAVGPWEDLEPADRDDPRVTVLVVLLASHPWRAFSLHTLCRHVVALLHDAV